MDVGSSGALLTTLRALLARGVALADALPPFTSNPARLLRLGNKGSIAPGADADLVALEPEGAPHAVIVRGDVHLAGSDVVRRGAFEAPVVEGPREPPAPAPLASEDGGWSARLPSATVFPPWVNCCSLSF
jgi:adenine deaminase